MALGLEMPDPDQHGLIVLETPSRSPQQSIASTSPQPAAGSSAATSFSNDFSIGRPGTASSLEYSDSDYPADKEGRVVLRMEVTHTEHSFLIGSGGETVRKMRAACSCLIHYPDANGSRGWQTSGDAALKVPYPHLHENEVSVRGKLQNVIAGFQKVRESIPFSFSYATNSYHIGRSAMDMAVLNNIAQLETIFDIEVKFKPAEKGSGQQVSIRGGQSPRTLLGVEAVCSFLAPHMDKASHSVTQTLCIHPHSQSLMWSLCDGELWLRKIAELTHVLIVFPNPRGTNGDKQTVTLSGNIRAVAAAWIIIMSMLPVTLRVFVGHDVSYQQLDQYITKQLGVSFLVPKKEAGPQDHPYVELKSYEGNAGNLCRAYRSLMEATGASVPRIRVRTTEETLTDLGLDVYKLALMPLTNQTVEPPSSGSSRGKPKYFLHEPPTAASSPSPSIPHLGYRNSSMPSYPSQYVNPGFYSPAAHPLASPMPGYHSTAASMMPSASQVRQQQLAHAAAVQWQNSLRAAQQMIAAQQKTENSSHGCGCQCSAHKHSGWNEQNDGRRERAQQPKYYPVSQGDSNMQNRDGANDFFRRMNTQSDSSVWQKTSVDWPNQRIGETTPQSPADFRNAPFERSGFFQSPARQAVGQVNDDIWSQFHNRSYLEEVIRLASDVSGPLSPGAFGSLSPGVGGQSVGHFFK